MDSKEKHGLALLDDEVLAQIVEADIEEHGQLDSEEAKLAFLELSRRGAD